jgi:hypothetical protein
MESPPTEMDVVIDCCVNPTTKSSRKDQRAFREKNPGLHHTGVVVGDRCLVGEGALGGGGAGSGAPYRAACRPHHFVVSSDGTHKACRRCGFIAKVCTPAATSPSHAIPYHTDMHHVRCVTPEPEPDPKPSLILNLSLNLRLAPRHIPDEGQTGT